MLTNFECTGNTGGCSQTQQRCTRRHTHTSNTNHSLLAPATSPPSPFPFSPLVQRCCFTINILPTSALSSLWEQQLGQGGVGGRGGGRRVLWAPKACCHTARCHRKKRQAGWMGASLLRPIRDKALTPRSAEDKELCPQGTHAGTSATFP